VPQRLLQRLCRLFGVFDFGKIILNKHVATLHQGMEFGELALNSEEPRQASIAAQTPCLLAYIERDEYKRVLKRALQKETQLKMQFLKANRIFEDVSTGRLQKMSYQMKQIRLVKN